MPAGLHSVWVYPDPAAGGWSLPIASNPDLTLDAAGWIAGPFAPGWTWSNGGVSGGTWLGRDPSTPVARVPDVVSYRLRTTFTVAQPVTVWWAIYLGMDPIDAWAGPFFRPGRAIEKWAGRRIDQAGTYSVETTWDMRDVPEEYAYLSPNVRFTNPVGAGLPNRVTSLELTYQGGAGLDVSCLVDTVTVNHGRDDATAQPEASSATVELSTDVDNLLPPELDIGAVLVVTTATERTTLQRFVGRITDILLGWDEAGTDTPDAGVAQVVATGMLADLGRRVVGDVPWPQELDGSRVVRIMDAAGVSLSPLLSDPGTVQLLPRDVDSQPALDMAHEAAESAGGIVWSTRGGEVRYADAEHRRNTPPSLSLDACQLLVSPTWRRTVEGLINQVSIGYGPTPEEGEQPRYLDSDSASMTRWGRYEYVLTTELAGLEDAAELGRLLLARNSQPVWIMAALPVDVVGLDRDDYEALLGLEMHDLVTLTGLPAISTAPTTANLWVEGYREVLSWATHELELVVSGYCRTAPAPRWDDVSPAWTWDEMPQSLTWDDAACLGPPADLGRWNDQAATLRWDAIDPSLTWDTYR